MRNRSIGRILYTRFPGRAIIPLDIPLLACSSHLPACSGGPPCRHKAGACLFDVAPDRGCRVSPCHARQAKARRQYGVAVPVCIRKRTRMADSSLWPCSSAFSSEIAGRPLAAIPPDGVRTFLGAVAPRLPDLPRPAIVRHARGFPARKAPNCDNKRWCLQTIQDACRQPALFTLCFSGFLCPTQFLP